MPISGNRNNFISKTDSNIFRKLTPNIAISNIFRIKELTAKQTKFPMLCEHFLIPCVLPYFFGHFPGFPCAVGTMLDGPQREEGVGVDLEGGWVRRWRR